MGFDRRYKKICLYPFVFRDLETVNKMFGYFIVHGRKKYS
jgi:hypothetical protein